MVGWWGEKVGEKKNVTVKRMEKERKVIGDQFGRGTRGFRSDRGKVLNMKTPKVSGD